MFDSKDKGLCPVFASVCDQLMGLEDRVCSATARRYNERSSPRPRPTLFSPPSPSAMDPMRSVFSRGPSPPRRASFDVLPNPQDDPALTAPSDPAPVNSSPNVNNSAIDALFSNLTTNAAGPQNYPSPPFMNTLTHPTESNSAPATPGSLHTVPGGPSNPPPTGSPPTNNATNVLLSLLSTVSGTASNTPMNPAPPLMPVMQPQQPQQTQSIQQAPTQVPTPPGSANTQRANIVQSPNSSENQGKILLDQLMSGYVSITFLTCPFCKPSPIVSSLFLTSLTSALLLSPTSLILPRRFLSPYLHLFPPLHPSSRLSLKSNPHGLR